MDYLQFVCGRKCWLLEIKMELKRGEGGGLPNEWNIRSSGYNEIVNCRCRRRRRFSHGKVEFKLFLIGLNEMEMIGLREGNSPLLWKMTFNLYLPVDCEN